MNLVVNWDSIDLNKFFKLVSIKYLLNEFA